MEGSDKEGPETKGREPTGTAYPAKGEAIREETGVRKGDMARSVRLL